MAAAGPQVIQNIRDGQPLMTNVDAGQVAKAAAIGAAAGTIGGLTFGVGLAAGGALAGAVGVSSASGAAATAIGAGTVAFSGAAAGQTSRLTTNVLSGHSWNEGLLQPGDMLIDATLSMAFFKVAGGNFNQIAPSDLTQPGAYARESISVRGGRATSAEKDAVQSLGNRHGCHTCGATSPGTETRRWNVDHQPPNQLADGASQRGYPHCSHCSGSQGWHIANNARGLVYHIWNGAWRPYYAWGPLWEAWDHGNEE